jgi:hypothetical protein
MTVRYVRIVKVQNTCSGNVLLQNLRKFSRERGAGGILLRLRRLVDRLFCYHPVNLFAEYGMCIKSPVVNRYSNILYFLSIMKAAAIVKFGLTSWGSRKYAAFLYKKVEFFYLVMCCFILVMYKCI